uniref:HotDog ACOT-type domain-containing protein n=1 Tax=Plectus sambesii TaxID=2011161 RepID=A0A914VRK3_9BILA
MEDSKLKTVIICFPAQRNLYNKIFGGFLMRQAFELAWANCALFSKSRPLILAVDDIMFRKSVEVGSLLFLSSQ